MNYKLFFILNFLLFAIVSYGQEEKKPYSMKPNKGEAEIDILSSYYEQDGNNAAVTGGIGTEKLIDIANMVVVNVPIDSINSVNLMVGVDAYSSASTDRIDNNISSASREDVRTYGTLNYQRKNLKNGQTYGIKVGGSGEYDYTSFSSGVSWAKESRSGNSEISLVGQVFIDQWEIYLPKELRGEVSVPTKNRQSFNLQAVYSQVINKRLQMSISGEAIYMGGLLSTPFHRVYFDNQTRPDIERLPNHRLKIPVSLRLNYYPMDNLVVRGYYRFYYDDFGILGHTASLEIPVKIKAVTLYPFYRYHSQTASKYFAAYRQHTTSETFYTSDYDLSGLNSHKFGLGIKYAPTFGLLRGKIPLTKTVFQFKSIGMRGSYYQRSTGLNAYLISLNLKFGLQRFKDMKRIKRRE